MTAEQVLLVAHDGPVTTVTLNRPERLNAIGPETVAALDAALDDLPPQNRVLVIAARGRAFSAGGDLTAISTLAGDDALERFHASISAVLRRIELLPVPVVAAVNGITVAGGLELVAACDIAVAAESATFGDGHPRFGLLPGGGGSVRLPRRIGVTRAKYLMFTGESVPAATMQAWGLVSRVVPDDALRPAVEELSGLLAARSRDGLARMKDLIDTGLESTPDDALAREQVVVGEHTGSADYHEGLAAFRERRAPRW
ncbi:enoyl-CoA hydratase/isomerase family protein [Pseudonocardia kongjuensis]|uniref:Enoyl-CoA hydratase/isomerase family protein n=1 Tax=Pseudonocardia kongjuensis TaxID=102227 RepID=A0ABN1XPE6_9PSEU